MAKKHKAHPFVMVRRDLLKDPKWRKLSNSTKVLYIYLRLKFNYKKVTNEVSLSYGELKDMMSSRTVSKGFKELMNRGFIKKTKQGGLFGGVCSYEFIGEYKHFLYKGNKI